MASELQVSYNPGRTVYFLIRNAVGQIWNTVSGSFGAYVTGDYSEYVVSATEQGTASAFYAATMPAAITAGVYSVVAKNQAGGSPAETDATIGTGDVQWNGSATAPLSDAVTSGQLGQFMPLRLARSQMIQRFPIYLVSAADHVTPFTSGVLSGQISKDGGSFAALQSGAFTEIGLGHYYLQALTSGDLSANTIALHISAAGVSGGNADPRNYGFILQRISGYN